jgi:hypothetical protein
MDGACSMHGRYEKTYTIFVTKTNREEAIWRLVDKDQI